MPSRISKSKKGGDDTITSQTVYYRRTNALQSSRFDNKSNRNQLWTQIFKQTISTKQD